MSPTYVNRFQSVQCLCPVYVSNLALQFTCAVYMYVGLCVQSTCTWISVSIVEIFVYISKRCVEML